MGIKMTLFGVRVDEDSLKNLVKLIGENYDSLISEWEKSQKNLITSKYFGKVLYNASKEGGINAKVNLYAESFYDTPRDSDGNRKRYSYRRKINKIKSLEGALPNQIAIEYQNITNHLPNS